MKVSLHLIEDVLRSASQHNGAGSWGFALDKVREILITDFSNVEKSAFSSDVRLLDLFGPIDDLGSRNSGDSDIVGFSNSSDA